jgi:3-isopropylmalate/(R)-2-methylmalate dehydratase small subunit|nr:3-isopropylmalate dehydratase small subunit [uncultured Brevundimonas sp.]
MTPFTTLSGVAAPLPITNIDTDKILAGRFLKTIKREGLGEALFDSMRRHPDGAPRADFVLNQPPYDHAVFIVALDNFGCGSSREHAPWALADFGVRCIVAPSFADIFANNCSKNGILPVVLTRAEIDWLIDRVSKPETAVLAVDLPEQTLQAGDRRFAFDIAPGAKKRLVEGLDEIGGTLRLLNRIEAFETGRQAEAYRFPSTSTAVLGLRRRPAG